MTSFAVATFNIGDTGTSRDLIAVASRADVVCLQEAGDRGVMLRAFCTANPGWSLHMGTLDGAPSDPVLVNTDKLGAVTVIDHPGVGARKVGRGKLTRSGWSAAGPSPSKPKPMTEFRLADGTSIFNLHTIASVTKTEKVLGTFTYNARRKHYRDHLYALLAVTTTLDGPVIACGDFNAEPDFELLAPLHNVGFVGWTVKPTHDTRFIDHVVSLPDRGLTVTGPVVVLETDSDHNAVIVPFEREAPDPVPTITQRVARNARDRGLTVVNRQDWGSTRGEVYAWRRVHKPHSLLPAKPVDTVWQHITVTKPSGDFAKDCRLIESIGMDRFGTGCSYNFMVDMTTGHVGIGQPMDAKGAHTLNDKGIGGYSHDQNAVSIAVAVIGMPETRLSDAAELAIATLIAAAIEEDAVTPGFDYNPHSFVAAKDCPCDSTRDRMPAIRATAVAASKRKP